MRILMLTNTFTPMVGGVTRSVEAFVEALRAMGHRVMVVAPTFDNMPDDETDVVRVPAIQNFNGSDFSVVLPIPGYLHDSVEEFNPEVVHSHHPFLLGTTAIRIAQWRRLPIVFTHHTMYEHYSHYVPGDSPRLKKFAISLVTNYCNLCDQVIAPSESVAEELVQRGIETPIEVIPTGLHLSRFKQGNASGFRRAMGIPRDAYLIGHLGRLAQEKNLLFLSEAVAKYMKRNPKAHFLLVGTGSAQKLIKELFKKEGVRDRVHEAGTLSGPLLVSSYKAMDVFAFASKSETQGMVVTEAMAAGTPVVGIDASGVREAVIDEKNGRLIPDENIEAFIEGLEWVYTLDRKKRAAVKAAAKRTAKKFSMENTAAKLVKTYEKLIAEDYVERMLDDGGIPGILRMIKSEWDVLRGYAEAAGDALTGDEERDKRE